MDIDLSNTKSAALELQSLLECGICHNMLQKPYTLGRCEHFFCCGCIQHHLGNTCPLCGVPSFKKDMQPSRELASASSLCQQLLTLLSAWSMPKHTERASEECDELTYENAESSAVSSDKLLAPSSTCGSSKSRVTCEKPDTYVSPGLNDATEVQSKGNVRKAVNKLWQNGFEKKINGKQKQRKLTEYLEEPVVNESLLKDEVERDAPSKSKRGRLCNEDGIVQLKESTLGVAKKVRRKSCLAKENEIMENVSLTRDPENSTDDVDLLRLCEIQTSPVPGWENLGSHATSLDDMARNLNAARAVVPVTKLLPHSRKEVSRKSKTSPEFSAMKMSLESTSSDTPTFTPVCNRQLDLGKNIESPNCKREMQFNVTPISVTPTSRGSAAEHESSSHSSVRSKRRPLKSPASSKRHMSSPGLVKRNAKGETVLHLAAIKGDVSSVKTILESGFNPDVKDNAGWTPLHEACNRGFVAIAEMLLDFNSAVDMPGGDNETPLHDAVCNGRVDCVKLLVSRGASVAARDRHGRTPLELAFTDEMKSALQIRPIEAVGKQTKLVKTSCLPSKAEMVPEKVVCMTSGIDKKEKRLIKKYVRELGWTMSENCSLQVTHLIVPVDDDGHCKRTIKFLQAVVSGLWVVSVEWLMQCHKRKVKVPEDEYEVTGTNVSPGNMAPRRARLNREKQLPSLFDGCRFYLHGEFGQGGQHPVPTRDELTQLVRLGGGTMLSREPRLDVYNQCEMTVPYHADPNSALADCSFFVVCSSERDVVCGKGRRLCRVPPAWVLACVAEFKLIDKLPVA